MAIAPEIELIVPGLWLWHAYDPKVKAELYSTALAVNQSTYLIDPVPLAADAFEELGAQTSIAGIIVTNQNHTRAASEFANRFKVPIHDRSRSFASGLTAIPIEGAVSGEIAVHSDAIGGIVVMGDALINFEPYGFTFLPAK